MATIDSIDGLIASANAKNTRPVMFAAFPVSATQANITSGYATLMRSTRQYTLGSFGSGVTQVYGFIKMFSENQGTFMAAVEIDMGTLTVSTNAFVDGSTMGSRTLRIDGANYTETLASIYPLVVVTTTLTATTPVLTITYTNQAGTGSRTCTMTLPSNPVVSSCFRMWPHLQSGDTGVRDITNVSISTGSAGIIKILGLLPLHYSVSLSSGAAEMPSEANILTASYPIYPLLSGDVIGFYQQGTTGQTEIVAVMNFIADI